MYANPRYGSVEKSQQISSLGNNQRNNAIFKVTLITVLLNSDAPFELQHIVLTVSTYLNAI